VDFGGIFSKLAQYDYDRWAVIEWECCLKHPEDGAAEGAAFISEPHYPGYRERRLMISPVARPTAKTNRKMLGL
jgi:hypothetical protein